MNGRTLVVLDFDGVICDTIDECFVSSWIAYHSLYRKEALRPPARTIRNEFARLRPFVRSGEDFVRIQEILATGARVTDQTGFDELTRQAGEESRERFREVFYQARTEMLERDRDGWLGLSRIYPHVILAFAHLPREVPLYVLSTKKREFVEEIVRAEGIQIPFEKILWSDREPKLTTVHRLLDEGRYPRAVLVDDQIDYLVANEDPRIRVYLAAWGYVQKEWLCEPLRVPLLAPQDLKPLLEEALAPARSAP